MLLVRASRSVAGLRWLAPMVVRASSVSAQHSCYVQGQYSDDGRREYFYYVDHQGMVSEMAA